MENKTTHSGISLEKIYLSLEKYKWLLISLMLISTLLMSITIYFTPSVYLSKSILEIKSKPKIPNDSKVEREIEILKTFSVNKKALEKIDFSVKYFKSNNYKNIEIYTHSPIKVNTITIYNLNIIDKEIILYPQKDYFTLSIKNSFKDVLFKFFSPQSFIQFDDNQKYHYGKRIKNKFFEVIINKNSEFKEKIKFILCGSNRQVYSDIIQKNLKVQQINPDASLIEISFKDTLPQRGNNYIDALSKSFIDLSIQAKNEQNNKVLTFINEQLNKTKAMLQFSEDKLERYKTTHKMIEPSIQAQKYIEKLSQFEIQLSKNLLKQKLISNLLDFASKNSNLDTIATSLIELNDKSTLQLSNTLQSLQIKESNLKSELTSKHPQLITIRTQMDDIRHKIVYNLKNLRLLILQKNRSLNTEKSSYLSKIETLPKKEKNIVNINRDYQINSNMYNYLLKKKTDSELLVVSTLSDYKIIDKAYANKKAIKPKKTQLMLFAPLIGLLLGIILVIILQILNKKIASRDDLIALTKLPILGLIPELKKKNIQLEVYTDLHSRFTESYRSLRTNIDTKIPNENAKVILITSTVANEGKTTITSNLASIFQMAGHKSIILNLDLRKPTLHDYFDLHNEKGMSTYLTGQHTIQDIIFATKYTNLHVITSGPIPHNPSELILSKRLTELLEVLETRYDYIFIDSAPIGLVSDSIPLMKLANQNILVLRENFSEESFLSSIHNIIKTNELKNIGLVLNRSTSKSNSYGYGYGYGDSDASVNS